MKKQLLPTMRAHQNGASLIEVLVAIFIFSIGMLGIAALSSAAIRYQTGNVARSAVAASINDFADRLRGNIEGANGHIQAPASPGATPVLSTGYVYTATYTAQQGSTIAFPTSPDCATAICTSAQLSAYDTAAWRLSLRNNLPGGAGHITGNVRNGFDITVMWYDKEFAASDDSAFTDKPEESKVCNATDAAKSPAARFCCPATAAAPAGVRCYTAKVFP
jgi:type IV pilus assembly protein PilV